jgi:hypothetical protein
MCNNGAAIDMHSMCTVALTCARMTRPYSKQANMLAVAGHTLKVQIMYGSLQLWLVIRASMDSSVGHALLVPVVCAAMQTRSLRRIIWCDPCAITHCCRFLHCVYLWWWGVIGPSDISI